MIHFFIVILVIQKVFSENFPQKNTFDRFIKESNTSIIIYNGNIMKIKYFEFNISKIETIIEYTNESITYKDDKGENKTFNFSNNNNEKNNSDQSDGEIIFVEYEILSYYLLFFGFLIVLYGSCHYILGIIFHISLVLYFFIKDFCELFFNFSSKNIFIYFYWNNYFRYCNLLYN